MPSLYFRCALLVALLIGCAAPPSVPPPPPSAPPPPKKVVAPPPSAPPLVRLDDETWFPYAGVNVADRRGTALDASGLLDAPAGKHGLLGHQGEAFVFADGSKARFWGMSINGQMNFPNDEQAEFIADFAAQLGFNLTTHVVQPGPGLDADGWQRFDGLIAKLVARGIHIALDLGELGDELALREFLAHKNSHTGKTYASDPAVVLLAVPEAHVEVVRGAGYRGLVSRKDWTRARALEGEEMSLIERLATQRVPNTPLLAEWSSTEGRALAMVAAYSGLHGTSAIMDELGGWPIAERDQLDCRLDGTHPRQQPSDLKCQGNVLALWPALSRLFHGRHVKESPIAGQSPGLAWIAKTSAAESNGATSDSDLLARYVKGGVATSVTGELVAESSKGLFKFDTPRSQGVSGSNLGRKHSVSNLSVSLKTPYATVIATSLDDKPLARSKRILISAVGRAVNRGGYPATQHDAGVEGSAPVMLEPILGSIELNGLTGVAASSRVYYLSQSGQRVSNVPFQTGPGIVRFETKAEYRTLHYEIVRDEPVP